MTTIEQRQTRQGVVFGIAAYGLWGFIPLYFKAVASVAPSEVLAHRILWSFVVLAILVACLRRWGEVWRQFRSLRTAAMLAMTSLLIGVNWLAFIYAVGTAQVVQASLGYFVAPLMSVLLGVVLLRERLRPLQTLSLILAVFGMLAASGVVGRFPWLALVLALSMAFYGLLRKLMPVDSLLSTTIETLTLTPLCLGYLGYLHTSGLATGGPSILGLLMLSGPLTTVSMLLFGGATRRLPLSKLAFIQYLTPSLQFLVAVVAFGETFSLAQLLSFACIWTAIAIYCVDSVHSAQQDRIPVVEPE